MRLTFQFRDKVIEVVRGDITKVEVDAIVNAANEGLRGGGGVDGAIHRGAGPSMLEELRRIGHCPTGKAVITTGGRLPVERVIHAVGPVWQGGGRGEAALLKSAYESSLGLAGDHKMKSIAFPSISTGAYGYPIEQAAPIAIRAVVDALDRGSSLERVVFVLFSQADYETYLEKTQEILGRS
jgi:O-acetyl-ADP-ribose deacetylase (regulator of RNase III)